METPSSKIEHALTTADFKTIAARWLNRYTPALAGIVALAGLALVAVPPAVAAASDYRPVCAVGYYGTTIDIELQGWRAGYECRHAVETIAGTYETSAKGPPICGRRWHNLDQTIRDSKPSGGWGLLACASLGITKKAA